MTVKPRATGRYCWNCGKAGIPDVGSRWHCLLCDVSWFPIQTAVQRLNDHIVFYGEIIDVIDFTDPSALSSPA